MTKQELDKSKEQTPSGDSKEKGNQPAEKTFSVNGQDLTGDKLLESYNNLQKEFTQRNQKASEDKKTSPELEQTEKILKEMGFTTKGDLEQVQTFMAEIKSKHDASESEKKFNDFIQPFNTLSDSQKKAIKDLKKASPDKTYEDIVKDYSFLSDAELAKAKQSQSQPSGGTIGLPAKEEKKESIMDRPSIKKGGLLSEEEYSKRMASTGL